jgi:hypothetical protein
MNLEVEIEADFEKIKMILYTNGIMNVIFKEHTFVELKDVEEVVSWVDSLGRDRKYVNLMEAGSNSHIDAEVRAFSASKNQNKHTIADGIVMTGLGHKLLSNFYLRVNKPVKPTKFFVNREKAIQWLLEQKELYSQNS